MEKENELEEFQLKMFKQLNESSKLVSKLKDDNIRLN